jgi:hypothetical protein
MSLKEMLLLRRCDSNNCLKCCHVAQGPKSVSSHKNKNKKRVNLIDTHSCLILNECIVVPILHDISGDAIGVYFPRREEGIEGDDPGADD